MNLQLQERTQYTQKWMDTNMRKSDKNSARRRAGQRPDELLPGENSESLQKGDEATGSPSGGLPSTGLEGLPIGDGSPGNAELSEVEDPDEPQSGFSGGAVGGTPANKRTRGK